MIGKDNQRAIDFSEQGERSLQRLAGALGLVLNCNCQPISEEVLQMREDGIIAVQEWAQDDDHERRVSCKSGTGDIVDQGKSGDCVKWFRSGGAHTRPGPSCQNDHRRLFGHRLLPNWSLRVQSRLASQDSNLK
jgi:hypothetical protein